MREEPELTCREVAEFLAAYLDDELAARQKERFEEHLAECPDCRNYLEQYEVTRTVGKAALEADASDAGVPEDLVQAILAARPASRAAVDGASPTPPRRPSRRR